MIASVSYGFYVVEVTNDYPHHVVYAGYNFRKAFRLFEKFAKRNSVKLWINDKCVESREKI